MSKRTVFTTVTPLPAGISRQTVMETLHDHLEMIDLNPLVEERHPIKAPRESTPEEYHCQWYQITDRVAYLPGGLASGKVSYNACFHDLATGLQTHVYAPMGLNIKGKWTLGGSLPGEPVAPVEMGVGVPLQGLWLREDVDMKCNIMMTTFVKKTLKKSHSVLVDRLQVKAQIVEAAQKNQQMSESASISQTPSQYAQSTSDLDSGSMYGDNGPVSPALNPYPHPPPPQYEHPALRADYDTSLYPKALSTRSSMQSYNDGRASYQDPAAPNGRTSYQDSMGSQHGRSSYQAQAGGGQNAGARVSWQNLNPGTGRSPSMQQIDAAYQKAAYPRESSMSHSSDGSAQGRRDSGRVNSGMRETGYPGPPPPPKVFPPVELE